MEYYFACIAGGGHDSGWQDDSSYEDTALMADIEYTYQVMARDKSTNQNATAWSIAVAKRTDQVQTYTISGSAGLKRVVMTGLPGDPVTDAAGLYSVEVIEGWSGTVTPTIPGASFAPVSRTYTDVNADYLNEDYTATIDPGPPTAINVGTVTYIDQPVLVELYAIDDGLPAGLNYIITSLPNNGSLSDPLAGPIDIDSIEYTLAGGGNTVLYTPDPLFGYTDRFSFKASDGGTPPSGGDSNQAIASVKIVFKEFFTEIFSQGDNDLDYQAFTYVPDGSSNFYKLCRDEVSDFPTDPVDSTVVSLADDSYAEVVLVGSRTVSIFGTPYSSFWINSNGSITFDSGKTTANESIMAHFKPRRVSALFDDLDPSAGGWIGYKQLGNRVVVTYQDVPEIGVANSNSFQIELFFDGTICMTYLNIDALDGMAGLSGGGGIPPGFAQTDLSEVVYCSDFDANTRVNLSDFMTMANYWMGDECTYTRWCDGSDLDRSGKIDVFDLDHILQYWMEGLDKQEFYETTYNGLSIGDEDGRVWGSEDGGISKNFVDSDPSAILLGGFPQQDPPSFGYAGVVSFDTSEIPVDATLLSARLELIRGTTWPQPGPDPFSWGSSCYIDIATPYLGGDSSLAAEDFDAVPDANHIAYFTGPDPGPDNVLVSTQFNTEGIDKINKNGTTQLRFRFTNLYDVERNHLGFYSGDYSDPNYHPKLVVDYVAPTDTKAPAP
ncbi:MAG: hypothetical protein KAT00_05140, partial [Planctomycetes bacterium]|nr:hypothetical protein [Planctomycetota bacterium]